jgi:WD40 repeat protein
MTPFRITATWACLPFLLAWGTAALAADPFPAPSLPEPWKENPRDDVVLSPDGKLIAYTGPGSPRSSYAVFLIDRKTDREVRRIHPPAAPSVLLAFTPDEKRLLVGVLWEANPRGFPGVQNAVQVADVKTGELLHRFKLQVNQGKGQGVDRQALYGISDRMLVVAGDEEVATVYDLTTGKDLGDLPGKHRAKAVALTRDGLWFVTAGKDDVLCLWDVKRRALVKQLTPAARPIDALTASTDGKWFATLERDGRLRVFDREKFAEVANAPTMLLPRNLGGLRFTPDGRTLIAPRTRGSSAPSPRPIWRRMGEPC